MRQSALLRLGSSVLLLLAGCAKGPNEEELRGLVDKGVTSYMGKGSRSDVEIKSVTPLASTKLDTGDWRVDVKYTLLLKVAPASETELMTASAFVGCNKKDCEAEHRDSLTARKTAEGWTLVKREKMP